MLSASNNNHKMNGNSTNNSCVSKNSSLDDPEHDMGPKMPCPDKQAELLKEW